MVRENVFRAVASAFQTQPRYKTKLPDPLNGNSPFFHTAGPVFLPGGDGAILQSKLSKPWQVIYGYAYRVSNPNRYNVLQPPQVFAPKGVPTVGINMQLGQTPVTSPAVNPDGTFASEGTFAMQIAAENAFQYGTSATMEGDA
jgi:hypothetical protein